MDFHPDSPANENRGEDIVWDRVRQAFADEEGVAYANIYLYTDYGLAYRAPDILVVSRRFGVLILEIKGCRLSNIARIDGSVWSMRDWHSPEERPVHQANIQMFAAKERVERDARLIGRVPFHARVVMPFVGRREWEGAGYGALGEAAAVLCADDLSPDGLGGLADALEEACPRLSDEEWRALLARFSQSFPPAHAPPPHASQTASHPVSRPTIHRYDGRVPTAAEIRTATGIPPPTTGGDYHYLVATATLDLLRGRAGAGDALPDILPADQVDPESNPPRANLLFDAAIDRLMAGWLRRSGLRIPFSPIEHSYFMDAVEAVTANSARAAQYGHDARTWRTVIGRLDSNGLDLSDAATFQATAHRFAHPDLAGLARDLQQAFHAAVPAGEITWERAARRFIDKGYQAAPVVVMEGFSFLRPLQQRFAERVAEQNADLHIVHPFRPAQAYGYAALALTYAPTTSPFGQARSSSLATPSLNATDLDLVKADLFSDSPAHQQAQGDASVRIHAFEHRHAEVRDCIEQVASLLDDGYARDDIRIVTRAPDDYLELLLEELDLFLADKTARGETTDPYRDLFRVPPRQLLLTPLGRFVLTLYNVWQDGALEMDADAFATILSSGLLGHRVQSTVGRFLSVREQVFSRCRTQADWEQELAALPALMGPSPERVRLPSTGLVPADADRWSETLAFVVRLAQKLFDGTPRSIGEHVEQLRDALTREVDRLRIASAEQEVLSRILAALDHLEGVQTVAIPTDRFRDVLNGLVQDRELADQPLDDGRVAVMSAEGLDGSSQRAVFYLGLDSQLVPRAYAEPWPFLDDRLNADLAQDRYLFLAAVRAATERLFLSFARVREQDVLQPSPYLQEAASILGQIIPPAVAPLRTPARAPPPRPTPSPGQPFPRNYDLDPYTLSQLYHFALCPYRYMLERLDSRSGMVVSKYQLRFLARGVWLYAAYAHWAPTGEQVEGATAIANRVLVHARAVEPDVRALFPGFSNTDWNEVERDMMNDARVWAEPYAGRQGTELEIVDALPLTIHVGDGVDSQEVEVGLFHAYVQHTRFGGAYNRVLPPDAFNVDWLMYSSKPKQDRNGNTVVATEIQKLGLTLFAHHYTAAKGWMDSAKTAYNYTHWGGNRPGDLAADMRKTQTVLENLIVDIETQAFPKNPGDHCSLCSARQECLGVEPS